MPPTPQLDLDRLRAQLPVAGIGAPLFYAPVIPSTNSWVMERIADNLAPGTVVLTDAQPEGRGRQGRTWVTLPGQQILMSVVLEPTFAPHWLVMASALAGVTALEAQGISAAQLGIKWPNDVMLDARKVAGILIETTTGPHDTTIAVIGIGMNVNGSLAPWPEVAARATTLADAGGADFAREEIIVAMLRELGEWYGRLQRDPTASQVLLAAWQARLITLGRPATAHQGDILVSGYAEGVTPDGALILRQADGARRIITWGDVESGG